MTIPIYNESGNLDKQFIKTILNKKLALFLDYDGTLTPIVKRPDLALLSKEMLELLKKLSGACPLAVVSGRMLQDVRSKIKIRSVFYAGNHGLELRGPLMKKCFGVAYCKKINQLSRRLSSALKSIPNILIENKKLSISVHFREVDPSLFSLIENAIDIELSLHPDLSRRSGKKVIEIYPDIGWDKGRAVKCFLSYFQRNCPDIFPIYLGDDVTDEDAFIAVQDRGIGILVSHYEKPTKAGYRLKDVDEVYQFLNALLEIIWAHG